MPKQRTAELCQEITEIVHDARELLDEFNVSAQQQGAGINRDPATVLRELSAALLDLRLAAEAAHDAAER
jgi:hypothetical protein